MHIKHRRHHETTSDYFLLDHQHPTETVMSTIKPPFTRETAEQKVKIAQRLWNTRDPSKVCLAYTVRHNVARRYGPISVVLN